MGLRPSKGDEDLSGRVPLDPLFGGLINFSSRPTRASAADQGVRPGVRPTLSSTKRYHERSGC